MNAPISLEERMCGFAYCSNVYDAKNWTPDKVDPLQRANTPLVQRNTPMDPSQTQKVDIIPSSPYSIPKSPLLLMTDYTAYSPHEACQGANRREEEYFVQFWQHVDVLNYFIHREIAIPPPSLVNAGHRNGAQVLGTFSFEGKGNENEHTAAMLEKVEDRYWLADKLAEMASFYGFDGWLFNMEAKMHDPANDKWRNGNAMIEFIAQLKEGLKQHSVPKGGKVIW
jgi:endo-beta-N-acetylglucosaminidase D